MARRDHPDHLARFHHGTANPNQNRAQLAQEENQAQPAQLVHLAQVDQKEAPEAKATMANQADPVQPAHLATLVPLAPQAKLVPKENLVAMPKLEPRDHQAQLALADHPAHPDPMEIQVQLENLAPQDLLAHLVQVARTAKTAAKVLLVHLVQKATLAQTPNIALAHVVPRRHKQENWQQLDILIFAIFASTFLQT